MGVSLHLCQAGPASCGACCGQFNFADHSREAVAAELRRHTRALAPVPRTRASFLEVASALKSPAPAPLFPLVRVCPLLGFLDGAEQRVGCLAHPRVTGGADLRDCGVYSADTCETFTCPSFLWLDDALAGLVRDACADWYVYGLVVTDVEFVRGALDLLTRALCRPVTAAELQGRALPEVAALFALKAEAPGRPANGRVFGRFSHEGGEEPALRTLDVRALGLAPAPEDALVLCLGYAPDSGEALEAAREVVRRAIASIVAALEGATCRA